MRLPAMTPNTGPQWSIVALVSIIAIWVFGSSGSVYPGTSAVSSIAACAAPQDRQDGLRTADASIVGNEGSPLCAVLTRIGNGQFNIHSLLVARHGHLVAELYRAGPDRSVYSLWSSYSTFDAARSHDMRSISKSVVGLLYGILLSRGDVPGIDTPVASLYPDEATIAQSSQGAIRIRDLLTMSTGLDWDEPSPVHRPQRDDQNALFWRGSPYRHVFDRAVAAPPGQSFRYSGGATAVLADIIVRSTGRPLRDLVRDELFSPLGITDWSWTGDLRGRPLAFAGLRLRPRDLMKIGLMILDHGKWQGRQIVPADWIAASTTPHIRASAAFGYGFQWWTSDIVLHGRQLAVAQAIGNGGQRLFLVPALDLAVVMTAGDYGSPAILRGEDELFAAVVAAAESAPAEAAAR